MTLDITICLWRHRPMISEIFLQWSLTSFFSLDLNYFCTVFIFRTEIVLTIVIFLTFCSTVLIFRTEIVPTVLIFHTETVLTILIFRAEIVPTAGGGHEVRPARLFH